MRRLSYEHRKKRRVIVTACCIILAVALVIGTCTILFANGGERAAFSQQTPQPAPIFTLEPTPEAVLTPSPVAETPEPTPTPSELATPEDGTTTPVSSQAANGEVAHFSGAMRLPIPDAAGTRVAYITFDDGPSTKTPELLDILDRYGVKATFFMVGTMIDEYPNQAKAIYDRGHALGLHSYTHKYKQLDSLDKFLAEMEKTNESLRKATGDENLNVKVLRFPGGSMGKYNGVAKKSFHQGVLDAGYEFYDWNSLNGDAEPDAKTKSVEDMKQEFINTIGGNQELVILMHDLDNKGKTRELLPWMIEYLKEKGFEFRTLPEPQ